MISFSIIIMIIRIIFSIINDYWDNHQESLGITRRRCGMLDFDPLFKPTSLVVPLSMESGHPMHIHMAWPSSELDCLARHSSDRNLFLDAKAAFLRRFSLYVVAPQSLLQRRLVIMTTVELFDRFSPI